MGRKKIEIQPITHERNRSVTFLKRKNGLFKKAYELGVLCSVDVAVIIFEERPGHHVKLYQYSSGDIHDIVQRHLRHDGEKDHKGPADFSGNTSTKTDDIGDDNDEDVDDDEDLPSRGKRGRDGKLKPPPDMHVAGMDYSHRSLSIPQAPPLSMHNPGHQGGPGLPISSDRFSNIRGTGKRSSSTAPYPGARQSGSGYHHATQQHHQTAQYPPFFPPQTSPSFMQTTGPGISSRSGQGYNISHHAGPSSPGNYDSAPIYPNIMGRPGSTPMQGSGPGGGGSLFSTFLEADEQSRHHQSHQQGQPQTGGFGLEWPVHGPGNANATSGHPSLPGPVTNPPPASSTDNSGQGSNNTWLDFLSSNNPPAGSTAREVMSWERGGGPPSSNSELYVDRGRHGGAGSPMVANIVSAGKRSPGSGLLSSPLTTVNGGDDGNKDIPG